MSSVTHILRIRTPEGIMFAHVLASPVARCVAWSIDLVVIMALAIGLVRIAALLSWFSADVSGALNILLYFAVTMGYGMFTEWHWRGQTPGKRLMRLRVMDAHGLRLQFGQIAIRNLLRAVDALPLAYLVGGIACLCNRRSQRLGDLAANTVVVHVPRVTQPDIDEVLPRKFNSLREHPHVEARLRQQVSPTEAALALQALLRRDRLEAAERVRLFAELAEHLRGKVKFPAEAVEGLTDEQFVRNVVDVVYRAAPGSP